jgi:pyrroline-5-carboxylate reductase
MKLDGPLLLVGCGKMGGALLDGWLARGLEAAAATVVEPFAAGAAAVAAKGVPVIGDAGELPAGFAPAVAVLAIKPQQMESALPAYRAMARGGTVFLSIAAGKPIGFFEAALGADAAVVRVMPNTPAAIGRGMSVLCANAKVDAAGRALCGELMSAVGDVAWVDDEALLDPVTAVSGSGPAYVFLLIESLAKAGVAAGLPEALATRLARETVAGAGELARQAEEPAETLRRNVTSPGGTTQAALEVLMRPDGLEALMIEAVAAATRRGRELAS